MNVTLSKSGWGALWVLLGLLVAAPGCKSGGDGGTDGGPPDASSGEGRPAAPAAPTAVAGDREATVTRSAPAAGGGPITRYTVTAVSGGLQAVVPGTTTTAVISGLTNGTAYTFTVFATNALGDGETSSPSNAVTPSATCPGLPALPKPRASALPAGPEALAAQSGSVGEYTPALQLVQAPQVWDANLDGALDTGAPTGAGIKVCILGTGIDPRHPELKLPYLGGRDFVEDDDDPSDRTGDVWGTGAGTWMAGAVAAQLGNAGAVDPRDARMSPGGVVGVAPGVGLLVARVLDTKGMGTTADIISGVMWCQAQGARIVAVGFSSPIANEVEKNAFASVAQQGVLLIAAAGSAGNGEPVAYPAAYPSVLAVGAVDLNARLASFSETGPELSLVAPGVDVLSTDIVGARDVVKELSAGGQSYEASPVRYSARDAYTGALVDCGLGDSQRSCQGATCDGFVALVGRGGTVSLTDKVRNVRAQGARAVILVNDETSAGAGSFTLGEPSLSWPPTVSVSWTSGQSLRGRTGGPATVSVTSVDYGYRSGTALAAAHVAGVAALVWSARPSLTPEQVRQVLESSAKDLGAAGRDDSYGHGLVQAQKARELLNTLP